MIREGPQILIDHVLIVGNQRTSRDTIMREVQLKSGQPLSQQQEDETRTRITALGLFRRVDISYLQLPGERNRRDVVITVEEAPVTTISYGGGLEGGKRLVRSSETADAVENFEFAPRGFFQVGRRNLFGKDRSLDLFTRVSFRPKGVSATPSATPTGATVERRIRLQRISRRASRSASGAFSAPTPMRTVSGGIEQAVRSSFDFNRRGASATITRRLSRTLAVSGRYGIDQHEAAEHQVELRRAARDRPAVSAGPALERGVFAHSRHAQRPDRAEQREPGRRSTPSWRRGASGRRSGSSRRSCRDSRIGACRGRTRRVLAFGARVGLATGFPRERRRAMDATIVVDDLPASERFFAGGDTTVRGFTLDRLGTPQTIDQDGFPTGGHGLIVLNAEPRIPIRGGLGAVAFVDGGNVWPTGIRHGSRRRCAAPSGSACAIVRRWGRFAWTWASSSIARMLPTGERERPTALHISLGQAFLMELTSTDRAESRGQRAERSRVLVVVALALCSLPSATVGVRAEVIDRVLAILPGQIITLSDVEAALDLGLVEAPAGADRIAGGLSAVIDRVLMLNEVRRVAPPEPSAAAIDARVARIRQRFASPAGLVARAGGERAGRNRAEAVTPPTICGLRRIWTSDFQRRRAADRRRNQASRRIGARQRLTDERRRTLIGAWTAELRRRADVTVFRNVVNLESRTCYRLLDSTSTLDLRFQFLVARNTNISAALNPEWLTTGATMLRREM